MPNVTKAVSKTSPSSARCVICHVDEDRAWADWISAELSEYEVPRKLVGRMNRRGEGIWGDLRPVATFCVTGLDQRRIEELGQAQFLLVICSPSAAASEALGTCVRTFKSFGMADRTIAAIVEGVPNAGALDKGSECFHEALRHEVDDQGRILQQRAEPLAADFRADGRDPGWFDMEGYAEALEEGGHPSEAAAAMVSRQEQRLQLMKLKLVAGILALNLGELTERDKAHQAQLARQRLFRRLGAAGILVVLAAAVFFGLMRLKDYQKDADKASLAEQEARGRSGSATREKELNEARLARQVEVLKLAEEREKGLGHLTGAGGVTRDRAEALRHLTLAANAGDVISQLWRAKILTDKTATAAEVAEGVEALRALATADKGVESAEAAFLLAGIYDVGKAVPRDVAKAVMFSEMAANRNHGPGMEQLAYMLERGLAGAARSKECLSWYEKSAAAGFPEGLFALFIIYQQGRPNLGIQPDATKSAAYLSQAIAAGSPRALHAAGFARVASAVSVGHWERAAEAGYLPSREALVRLYLTGRSDLPVSVEQGIRHLGLALNQVLEKKDVAAADRLAAEIIRAKIWSQCQSLQGSLKQAADQGSSQAAYAYALAATMASGKVSQPEAFAAYMRKAASKGLAEAQYSLGVSILRGELPRLTQAEGRDWVDKSAELRYPPALLEAIRYRIEDRSAPRDWPKISTCMQAAVACGLEVDWMKIPQRFRPEALQPKRPAPVVSRIEPTQAEADSLLKLSQSAGRRTKEEINFMLQKFPLEFASDIQLQQVGTALMYAGNYKEAVLYLSKSARLCGRNATYSSERLAMYYDYSRPDLAYEWRLFAQAIGFEEQRALVISRMKLTDKQKAEAFLNVAIADETHRLANAAAKAGVASPKPKPKSAAVSSPMPDRDLLVKAAEKIAAEAEFSEEIELALAAYDKLLESYPDETRYLYDAASLATKLSHGPLRFYWVLRAALAKQKPNLSNFEWCVELATPQAFDRSEGPDLIEASKWRTIARSEIESAQTRLPTLALPGDKAAKLASALARLELIEKANVDDSAAASSVRVRVALYRAQAATHGRH